MFDFTLKTYDQRRHRYNNPVLVLVHFENGSTKIINLTYELNLELMTILVLGIYRAPKRIGLSWLGFWLIWGKVQNLCPYKLKTQKVLGLDSCNTIKKSKTFFKSYFETSSRRLKILILIRWDLLQKYVWRTSRQVSDPRRIPYLGWEIDIN